MMMDNPALHHQQIVQINATNPPTVANIQQQQAISPNPKTSGEMDNFLTIRLLMQGKVRENARPNQRFNSFRIGSG